MEAEDNRRGSKAMTDEKRNEFVAELRRLSPLFAKSGVSDCFTEAANEIERLAEENRRLKITPLGIEAAAHAIRLAENNQKSLDHCRILARAAFVGAFP
jgi:hypothetical protein